MNLLPALNSSAVWGGLIGGLLVGQYVRSVVRRQRIRRETEDLRSAARLLEDHYDAFERFLDDPASPEPAKEFLWDLNDIISNKAMACRLGKRLAKRSRVRKSDASSREAALVVESVLALIPDRPDLAGAFYAAYASGISAMFLRYSEISHLMPTALPWAATHQAQEITDVRTVVRGSRTASSSNYGYTVMA